ncbi:polymer-forming cytoskeletal protein [Mucilaginibacter mali]|uniref:Polymer-forming cytoskeletal protein n=1 Tax=Mucilaginibacter mali TaxID=2740462 RepID=A0A7D4UDN4_9SPHI|nr:polymer-forming cytoskeletal protein [Mucilaginibacter mali]QKJ30779.1 polymer-forming cytoskeletal protein [Mucilaginibacter mali]
MKKGTPDPLIASNISSLVHEGDNYYAQDLVLINEALTANLYSGGECIVERAAVLKGNTLAKHCVISGTVTGAITGTERIEIKKTAVIKGTLNAPVIDIEPGAKVNGDIKVTTDIYAMIKLTDTLKRHLPTEELPRPLNIAADAVTLTPKTEELVKPVQQKPSVPNPAAAKAAEEVLLTPAPKPVVAAVSANQQMEAYVPAEQHKPVTAAMPANKPVEALTAATPEKKPVAAAAAKPATKTETQEAASGRWW